VGRGTHPLPALRADLSHCVGEVYGLRAPTFPATCKDSEIGSTEFHQRGHHTVHGSNRRRHDAALSSNDRLRIASHRLHQSMQAPQLTRTLANHPAPHPPAQRMMISTRRFCGSRTPGPVGTSRCVSPNPWMLIACRGTPSFTSSAATAWARRTDRPWL